jgi:hypothetical protein
MSNRKTLPLLLQKQIKKEQDEWCAVCLIAKISEIHHIVPVAVGGTNQRENLVGLCRVCHLAVPGDDPDGYEDEFNIYKDNGGPVWMFCPAFFKLGLDLGGKKMNFEKVYKEYNKHKLRAVRSIRKQYDNSTS